jgi:transposase
MSIYLQTIIGVDKKNPYITLVRDSEKKIINVYWGASLLEVVDDHPDNPNLKFVIARLFNAGLNKKKLVDTFGYCYNTIRRWGDALKTNDALTIVHAFSGQGAPKKLSEEIQSFVRYRFNSVYAKNKYSYSKIIKEDILDVYKLEISSETLRPLFNQLKISETIKKKQTRAKM